MTKQEYVNARADLGHSVKSWISLLAISQSTHDSVMCERKDVPKMAAAHINTLIKNKSK